MLKSVFLLLLSLSSLNGIGQSIASLNFRHLYDPLNEVNLSLKLVNEKTQLTVYFLLQPSNKQSADYSITWQKYENFMERSGTPLNVGDTQSNSGKFSFPVPEKFWLLLAKVASKSSGQVWNYLQIMDPKYPVNGFLEGPEGIVYKSYVLTGQEYTIHGVEQDKPLSVYLYKTDFPVASPPFTQKGAHVDRFMFADSSFKVSNGQKITLKSKGLYLVQQDTTSSSGFAFRAMSGAFPKLTKVQEIPEPLIYVCAKEEHDELLAAGGDKTKVDKVILDITRDRDRAKNFMRSYFRQVELSNTYFTAFKEGWKTDRGMLYLIFRIPDEVSLTGQNEVWYYKSYRERFTLVKNGSVYDPNNFVLQRGMKFTEPWFSTVDLWRKSRY